MEKGYNEFATVSLFSENGLRQSKRIFNHFTFASKGFMMKHINIPIKLAIAAAVFALFLFGCIGCDKLAEGSPAGTYISKLPSASGMGRITIIHLFANKNALRTNIYIGEPKGDYVEEGTWSEENGKIIIVLEISGEQPKKIELTFQMAGKDLISTEYDEKPFGREEIKFVRIPEFNL